MLYPENGHLTASSQDPKIAKTAFGNTPANMPSVKMLQMGDTIAGLAGTASSIAWYVASNWFIITVFTITAVWAILRGLYTLYERIKHRDSLNPFRHTEVWVLWIGLAMCCFVNIFFLFFPLFLFAYYCNSIAQLNQISTAIVCVFLIHVMNVE